MNQRIRELMIRAIADVDSINDPETRRMYIPNCFAERFTELIVRECASLTLDPMQVDEAQYYHGWLDYRDEILKHFGVGQ